MDRGDAGRAGLTPKSLVGGSARNAIAVAKFCDEAAAVNDLLGRLPYGPNVAARIEERAAELVARARADSADRPILDTFLSEYGLSNKEGVALMCLAESLLRIPDRATAERLIADKIQFVDWASHTGRSGSLLVNASTWALLLGSKLVDVDDNFGTNPAEWLGQLTTRLTEPVIEQAMRAAMRILGREFVLGSTIERALKASEPGQLYSYDMLGEAAREAGTAQRYLADYLHAIATVGGHSRGDQPKQSVSIKLSALHPRYEASQRDRVLAELVPAAKRLCGAAAENGLDLSIDAEESDRLELSLDVFERLATDPELSKLEGLGFVVQAYGKRALAVLEWLVALARETGRVIPVRLVKGAYWDAEIKHAQVQGYPGFPVYTRKPTTDLSYLVCARFILEHSEQLFGQFATHNAHTVAAVMEMAGSATPLEFQRLHGMGEMLYRAALRSYVGFRPLRTYAPVGRRDDLLAYLVRRLLENGANSSFVNRFLDEQLEPRQLVRDPAAIVR
ncbi:MAG TPA: proline dehydrogenase family protein, partial [Gammaproteobacteria bacterium]